MVITAVPVIKDAFFLYLVNENRLIYPLAMPPPLREGGGYRLYTTFSIQHAVQYTYTTCYIYLLYTMNYLVV